MSITNISDFKGKQRTEIDTEIEKGNINRYRDYLDNHSALADEYEKMYEKYVKCLLQECKDDNLCMIYNSNVRRYGKALIDEHKEKPVMKAINQFIRNIEKNKGNKKTLAVLYSDKSRCYLRGGDKKKAYKNAIDAYEINKEVIGVNAPETIRARIEISNLLSIMDKTKEAEEEMIKIHEESSEFFESDDPETLEILELMIYTYNYNLGETEGKAVLRKLLYEKSVEILGENNPRSIKAMADMLKMYREKDPDSYLSSIKIVYEKAVLRLGSNNPTVIDIIKDLAYAYKQNYCFCEALDLVIKAYEIIVEEHGRESKKAFQVLEKMAEYITDVKSFPKNYEVEQSYYDSIKDDYNEEEIATTIDNLKKMEYALKDYEKTLAIAEETKNMILGILEETEEESKTSCFWIAKAYEGLEEYNKSVVFMKKYYLYMVEKLGENHCDSIFTLCELANSYQMADRWNEAIDTYDKAWKQSEDTFGMDDSLTKIMRSSYYYAKEGQSIFIKINE